MARCPFARWLPVDFADGLPAHRPVRLLAHTNGGPGSVPALRDYFSRRWRETGQRLGPHFQVDMDGALGQYIDTGRASFTAFEADPGSISVETQDNGDHLQPWTPAQVATITRLGRWIRQAHPSVPAVPCPAPDGAGVAGHQWFASWNRHLHDCPGDVRGRQLRGVIIPALALPPAARAPGGSSVVVLIKATGDGPGPVYAVESGQLFHIDTAWLEAYAKANGLTVAEARAGILEYGPREPVWQLPQNA